MSELAKKLTVTLALLELLERKLFTNKKYPKLAAQVMLARRNGKPEKIELFLEQLSSILTFFEKNKKLIGELKAAKLLYTLAVLNLDLEKLKEHPLRLAVESSWSSIEESFADLEEDMEIILKNVSEFSLKDSIKSFLDTGELFMAELRNISPANEQEIFRLYSLLLEGIQTINLRLKTKENVIIETRRKIMLKNWNLLMDVLSAPLKELGKIVYPKALVLTGKWGGFEGVVVRR